MSAYANRTDCGSAKRAEMLCIMAAKKRPMSPDERARKKRFARNMRLAREAVGLLQNEAAKLLDVDPTTVNRWETRGQDPRAKWGDIERLYRTTRGAIEQYEPPANGASREPPYPAWREFLKWLDESVVRDQVSPWMLESMRALSFPEQPPTAEFYRHVLQAYLFMRPHETKGVRR